ncbi:MAG: uracil-DNA glycosylase [Gemmatimonadaceae bacterium]|nr:uracil-DNA glycosylase [Gemmatimonadaceae bacterium]
MTRLPEPDDLGAVHEPEPDEASPPEAAEVLSEVRRSLEDLLLFEGRWFVTPPDVVAASAAPARPEPAGGEGSAAAEAPVPAAAVLSSFHDEICECTRCPLGQTRNRFVFGSGNPEAGIMFVGEAPGEEEDLQGLPFVGPAGRFLTRIIEAMELSREEVYICNVLKCRPPGNRDPAPEEVATCEPYLRRQIEIVQPKVICCLGRHAAHALLKTEAPLSRLRGTLHEYAGIPVIVTYHPAALLRNEGFKRPTWEDVKWVRRQYDGVEPRGRA